MPTTAELQPLITDSREDISVEYKDWLDPTSNHGRATIARAAIALANHGGGFIVIGFAERGEALVSQPKPESLPAITQDGANATVRRYADPEFHVEVYRIYAECRVADGSYKRDGETVYTTDVVANVFHKLDLGMRDDAEG